MTEQLTKLSEQQQISLFMSGYVSGIGTAYARAGIPPADALHHARIEALEFEAKVNLDPAFRHVLLDQMSRAVDLSTPDDMDGVWV